MLARSTSLMSEGDMNRVTVNVQTGEIQTVELTPEEIAAAEAAAAAYVPPPRVATARQFKAALAMAGVISSESNKGTASNPRVNREELRRVRKARTMLRSKGKSFKRNGSA